MPTIKVSDGIYKELVSLAGSLQNEYGRRVTVGEALEIFFKKFHEWDINVRKIETEVENLKERKK